MKKSISCLVALVFLVLTLSGCVSTGGNTANSASGKGYTPGDEVTLRIVDWSDSSKVFREEFHEKFEKEHPGVTIEYTCLAPDEFKNSVVSLISSGDAPDLFPLPIGLTLNTVQKDNWYLDMAPYFSQEFLDTFADGTFQEGVTTIDGGLYTIPEQMALANSLIYYNKDILEQAGIETLPKTYSEFIEVCKKITEAGKGAYYGLIDGGTQLGRIDVLIRAFAGVAGGKISLESRYALTRDGRAPYDTKEVQEVFSLFNQLQKDGSIHPDTLTINAPEAREYFAQGQAAFLAQGLWCIGAWGTSAPDLNYGVMAVPVPDTGAKGGLPGPQISPWMGIYSQSKYPELAAEYLKCLYSEEYGYQQATIESGAYLSCIEGLNEKYMQNEVMKEYYKIAIQQTRAIPYATVRDNKAYDFYAEVVDVKPSMAAIFMGMLSESIKDYGAELRILADKTTEEWKRACEAAGVDFEVFEFENWDPAVDYTQEDYNSL